MQRIWIYLAVIFVLTITNTLSAFTKTDIVKVQLFSKEKSIKSVNIHSLTEINPLKISLNKSNKILISNNNNSIYLSNDNKSKQSLPHSFYLSSKYKKPVCISVNNVSKRCYYGRIKVSSKDGSILLINEVPTLDYLNSVASSEIPTDWPKESVKAQVVAIHTYLLYTIKSSNIVKDTTQNQFYGGSEYINRKYIPIISSVKDILMFDKSQKVIDALYHSTCDGHTYNNENIFGGKPDEHLRSVRCLYNEGSPFANTKVFKIQREKLLKKLNSREISIIRNNNKIIYRIKLDSKLYTPYEFWILIGNKLSWGHIPGISYEVSCNRSLCEFTSKGAGHGIGMCQWGSRGMALKGFNYKEILHYYYQNITIK